MSNVTVLVAESVEIVSGQGLLARRAAGVLFLADGTSAARSGILAAFLAAADAADALDDALRAAADEQLRTGPFAMVTWRPQLHVVVFGDLVVRSDIPALARLTGAGLDTWVEHRVPRPPTRCVLHIGGEPVPGSDLIAGVVPAGGLRIHLRADATSEPSGTVDATGPVALPSIGSAGSTTASSTAPAPAPAPPPSDAASPRAPDGAPVAAVSSAAPAPAAASSWDVLRDAGGAWMEESLRISDGARWSPAATTGDADPPVAPVAARDPGPPPTPAPAPDDLLAFDPEVTLDPRAAPVATRLDRDDAPPLPGPLPRMVQARRCERGHLNPPLRTACRTCGAYLPPTTPVETVAQPALATLLLPDGRSFDVDGAIVVGRQPTVDAARLDEPGELATIAGDPSVSRTHVVVGVDGWTLLATDCGTTAGTAIAPAGAEPVLLEPWVPHEIVADSTLFLGGRTQLRIVARR